MSKTNGLEDPLPEGMEERAIFEVKIGDQWVEWNRLERHKGQIWDEGTLAIMAPRSRVRFVHKSGTSTIKS